VEALAGVPGECSAVIRERFASSAAWTCDTIQVPAPGKQRGLAHFVGSAKKEATREKRAQEIALELKGQPGGKLPLQASRTGKQ
jgi:hypothetical protein